MSHVPALRPRFKPSTNSDGVKSVRTKRNLNGFAPSSFHSSSSESESDGERRTRKAPTFKRRSKKEEPQPEPAEEEEDTWSSFLKDLASAEHQFFAPTHAQRSAVLRYDEDEDDSNVGESDDSATVRAGTK